MSKYTVLILILGASIPLIWEGILIWKKQKTVSQTVRAISEEYPIVVFSFGLIIGLLAGHFWW